MNNLEFRKITSIKRFEKKQKVYNFNVPGYENYIANGFVVHNCENHIISQSESSTNSDHFKPFDIVELAIEKKCDSVCMTYNEPTIAFEYLIDMGNLCHDNNLKFIIKTNAYINHCPWNDICEVVDAVNVDFKGVDSIFKEVTGCRYTNIYYKILSAITYNVHVEVSIPIYGGIDMDESLYHFYEKMKELKLDIPCHLLRIAPAYKMLDMDITSKEEINVAKDILTTYFTNVYA